jgi:hypothetical protein
VLKGLWEDTTLWWLTRLGGEVKDSWLLSQRKTCSSGTLLCWGCSSLLTYLHTTPEFSASSIAK